MTDKVTIAIERIKEGALMAERFTGKPMVVCYSGGKDSDVLLHLAIRAGVEMEAKNSHTSCDAPETVRHIRQVFARLEDQGIPCKIVYPMYKGKRATMWSLIAGKGFPPTRLMRYCCSVLKESMPATQSSIGRMPMYGHISAPTTFRTIPCMTRDISGSAA